MSDKSRQSIKWPLQRRKAFKGYNDLSLYFMTAPLGEKLVTSPHVSLAETLSGDIGFKIHQGHI